MFRLTDGGLLVSYLDSSYTTYFIEDPVSYRITVGNRTYWFQKESDPTHLRAPTSGTHFVHLCALGS